MTNSIFESIEHSKHLARIRMEEVQTQTEKSYWIGVIGGLQIAKQLLETKLN